MKLNPCIGLPLLSCAHVHQEHWAKAPTADAQRVPRAFLDCRTSSEPLPVGVLRPHGA